jgi:hypothetical protein
MKWTKEHTAEALQLYLRERPKALDKGEQNVRKLAEKFGTSPGSVALKISNFIFLDPIAEGQNRKGMSGISEMDKEVWLELSGSPLSLRALESKNRRNPKIKMESPVQSSNFTVLLQKAIFAKAFTILTGNSGTGKTRSAEDLAEMFRDEEESKNAKNVALVAVGADWTDNRNVVGYVNHLREAKIAGSADSRPVYQSTPVLDLLLEASKPGREAVPHFLILDEMNLSHVERYFADFLSAMEARSGAIRFHEEGDFRLPRFEGDPVGVPRSLPYPQNLFVIGTVNVDETTYMFSPKVLDRAHVIEFEVDRGDVGKFLEDPKPLQPVPRAAAGQAEAFLDLSLRASGAKAPPLPELPLAVKTAVNKHLLEVLEILQNGRFEFAFRTAKEVLAYLKVSCELAADKAAWEADKWMADLDDEILQKILPRLHGSRTRVGPLLGALGWYLHSGDKEEAMKFFPAPGEELPEKPVQEIIALHKAAAAFPRSFAKVQRMARVVIEEQFVSFIC